MIVVVIDVFDLVVDIVYLYFVVLCDVSCEIVVFGKI